MLSTIFSILIVLFVLLLFLAAWMIFRATMYGHAPMPVDPAPPEPVDAGPVADHLSTAIRLETVSQAGGGVPAAPALESLQMALERMYPRLHAELRRERVNGYSLLYTWPGRVRELEPVLLCAHQDVVPSDPANQAEWTRPPFSGAIADGAVWGRGALDMKGSLISMLEAVEGLVKTGYRPARTVYLALGHDEEVGGWQGARCIVDLLKERGVRIAAVLDEGGPIAEGMMPGLDLPVALVGVSEKGHASFDLRVEGRAGHASMPTRHTAIGILARAITRMEAKPMPARLDMARLVFGAVGPFLTFSMRFALANSWLFGKTILRRLETSAQTNALVRTTMAATIIQGGVKDNILPATARAVVNCRMLPGDSASAVLDHLRAVVDDEAVLIRLPEEATWEASPISPVNSPVFNALERAIRQVFPDVVVAPYLMAGATDSRYYTPLCSNVYRFSPYLLNEALLKTVHGVDERIPVESLVKMVQFYTRLIQTWAGSEE